ncbi:hypothetical protein SAMN05660489_05719 [Pseudomonas sp. LAMO17WK12:I10]|nr:hypothetical protein H160_05714 [Pseudomonas sp. LAMO17WK12:I9]SNY51517.1 hypothetical protein SAMN05660489_05719 [Pseudomonas sp. LAMO17WK12:I10]
MVLPRAINLLSSAFGEYQIGEVQARSCTVADTSAGGGTCSLAAS